VSTVLAALGDYFSIAPQLNATNRALQETHNILNAWDGLSLVQRKMAFYRGMIFSSLETNLLNIVSKATGVSPALPGQGGDEEEE
jgi:hypothetical protein